VATTTISTPAGPFSIIAYGEKVLASGFTDNFDELRTLIHPALRDLPDDADLAPIVAATQAYFDGDTAAIDRVAVEQASGTFIETAWEALRKVGGGGTVTYTELAALAGRPAAIRGAAQACARNAAVLYVPCHRVIRADGSLGGYRYGLDVKRWLLAHEQASVTAEARSEALAA
jgi:methylated-DNA-[protein]-cysteine S-methyltransferase